MNWSLNFSLDYILVTIATNLSFFFLVGQTCYLFLFILLSLDMLGQLEKYLALKVKVCP